MKRIIAMGLSILLLGPFLTACGSSPTAKPEVLMTLKYGGTPGAPNVAPEQAYEAMGLFLNPIEIRPDGTISASYGGGTSVKLKETWVSASGSTGGTITLIESSIQGTYDASRKKGTGTLSISWKYTEEGGSGLEYEKYDITTHYKGPFDIQPAYNDANKPFGQLFLGTIGKADSTTNYTGKQFDREKREYYIGTSTESKKGYEYTFVAAYNVI